MKEGGERGEVLQREAREGRGEQEESPHKQAAGSERVVGPLWTGPSAGL